MTEKRFTDIEHDYENARIRCKDNGMFMLYAIYENDDGLPTLGDLLNEQDNRIEELETENNQLKREKERYKRLSEIRDENINNRILSIKEFINNCEDEKVKNTLEDLFYSEVKEYDLAKENRTLKKDNEQLKFKLNECKEHKLFSRRQLKKENIMLKEEIETLHEQLVHGIEDLCGDD